MQHPKFVQIACSPSYLFALGEDGEVYQLKEETREVGGVLTVIERVCEWVPADRVTAPMMRR